MAARQAMQGLPMGLALLFLLFLGSAHGQCVDPPSTVDSTCTAAGQTSAGQFIHKTILQSAPYPKECNNMTVFVSVNIPISIDTMIVFSGFEGFEPCEGGNVVKVVSGDGKPNTAFSSKSCGIGSTGSADWDAKAGTVSTYPIEQIEANALVSFHFSMRNPAYGRPSFGLK